jgi:hypothetical protein
MKKIENDCKKICSKKFEELPVSKDVIRLAHKVKILVRDDITTEYEIKNKENDGQINVIFNLFDQIGKIVQPDINLNKEEFLKEVNLDLEETLTKYILKNFKEGPVTSIFKTIQQTLIGRTVINIRTELDKFGLKFRDAKIWTVDIKVYSIIISRSLEIKMIIL